MALEHYRLKLKTLSPVHIGSGETISKTDAMIDSVKKTVYIPDNAALFRGLTELGLAEDYERAVMSGRPFDLLGFLQMKKVPEKTRLSWVRYSYPLGSMEPRRMNISACVKDAFFMPYIPGSSIKGALRTALTAAALLDDTKLTIDNKLGRTYGTKEKLKTMERLESGIEEQLFHTLKKLDRRDSDRRNAVNSVFKGLLIADSDPLPADCITLCQKTDIDPDGERRKLNVYRECIKPGTEIFFPVTIDTAVFSYSPQEILEAVSRYYDDQCGQFLDYFSESKSPKEPKEKYVLYLGGGTGFASKTVTYQIFKDPNKAADTVQEIMHFKFRKHRHDRDLDKYGVSPRMRKCTVYDKRLYDMGLCSAAFENV